MNIFIILWWCTSMGIMISIGKSVSELTIVKTITKIFTLFCC